MKSWHLVHTKAGQEQKANQRLQEQDYVTYLPMITPDKKKGLKLPPTPLFKTYLFINMNRDVLTGDDFSPIRSTPGVSKGIVMFGASPGRVSDDVIQELKSREQEGVIDLNENYKAGDKVRIKEGRPFALCEAIFKAESNADRVHLMLEHAKNPRIITVKRGDIELLA